MFECGGEYRSTLSTRVVIINAIKLVNFLWLVGHRYVAVKYTSTISVQPVVECINMMRCIRYGPLVAGFSV